MMFRKKYFLFLCNISFVYQAEHICIVFYARPPSLTLSSNQNKSECNDFWPVRPCCEGGEQEHFSLWPQPAVGGSVGVKNMSAGNKGRNCRHFALSACCNQP